MRLDELIGVKKFQDEDLIEVFESVVRTQNAHLIYSWKKNILDEEDEDYLPKGINPKKIIELELISVNSKDKISKGYGTEIMNKFLNSSIAKKAELIFLDINPYSGFNPLYFDDAIPNKAQQQKTLDQLEAFYRKFGFKNKRRHSRMWLVQKGSIPDSELPE